MNSLKITRDALSVCVVALFLAGCGGLQPPIGAPSAMHGTQPGTGTNPSTLGAASQHPLYGGAFSAL